MNLIKNVLSKRVLAPKRVCIKESKLKSFLLENNIDLKSLHSIDEMIVESAILLNEIYNDEIQIEKKVFQFIVNGNHEKAIDCILSFIAY